MELELNDWFTLAGSAIAAVTGAANLWLQLKDKSDHLIVRWGSLEPPIGPATCLYVVNRSKHKIVVVDYGFIFSSGELYSLPGNLDDAVFEEVRFQLLGEVEPGEHQEARVDFTQPTLAAFAKTAVQRVPRLDFRNHVPWRQRLWLRFHAIWGGMPGLRDAVQKMAAETKVVLPLPVMPPPPPPAP